MRFLLRKSSAAAFLLLLFFCPSCERHHLGEMPEVQREQLYPVTAESASDAAAASPARSASPTPAEFFPEKESP
jgi:hypothetical protein